MSFTPVANGKNLKNLLSEKFEYFVRTPLGSRVNIEIILFLKVHIKV